MYFWAGLIFAATAVGGFLWVLAGPWAQQRLHELSARQEPFWWPWVLAMAPWCAGFVSWARRRRLQLWGARAGLGAHWLPERWLAACILMALLGAALALFAAWMLDFAPRLLPLASAAGACCGFLWPERQLRRRAAVRRARMMRELPFMLDLMTLCVQAGLSLSAALAQVARHAPAGPLRASLRAAAALERTGLERAQWLAQWAENTDVPGVRKLVLTLAQADRLGMGLGPLLRAQAERERNERFMRAEKLALEAPVKMLFPMVLCIFPCTFLVIAFPLVVKFFDAAL